MTPFLLLTVVSANCAIIWAESTNPPPYAESYKEIIASENTLKEKILPINYEKNYQRLVDEAAAEAISNPQKVVVTAQKFLDHFNAKTVSIQKLIKTSYANDVYDKDCNEVIHNFTINYPKTYEHEAEILLVGGECAKIFNSNTDKFNYVSKAMDAHKYVIKHSGELKNVIYALSDVIRLVNPHIIQY